MLDRVELLSESAPLPFKLPAPLRAAYQVSIQAAAKRRWRRNEIWLDVEYCVEDAIAKSLHDKGVYQIRFQVQFDDGNVTPAELYQVVEVALRNFDLEISRLYEKHRPGIYCINGPSFEEIFQTLESCANWFNSNSIEQIGKRAKRL